MEICTVGSVLGSLESGAVVSVSCTVGSVLGSLKSRTVGRIVYQAGFSVVEYIRDGAPILEDSSDGKPVFEISSVGSSLGKIVVAVSDVSVVETSVDSPVGRFVESVYVGSYVGPNDGYEGSNFSGGLDSVLGLPLPLGKGEGSAVGIMLLEAS
jgi:hypothetical protein